MNPKDCARIYFQAFSAKDELALSSLMSESVTLRDWGVEVAGRDAVLAEMARGFATFGSIVVDARSIYADGNTVLAELLITLDEEQIKVLDVLEFDSASKLCAIRAYKG